MLTTIRGITQSQSVPVGWSVKQQHKQILLLLIMLEAIGLLVIGQRVMFDGEQREVWLLTWVVGLGTFALRGGLVMRTVAPQPEALRTIAPLMTPRRWMILGSLVPLASYVFAETRHRSDQDSHATLVLAW